MGFSVGYAITDTVKTAIRGLRDGAWVRATRQTGEPGDGAHVAEITDQLALAGYPTGSRVLVRREPLHPGAQQTIEDIDGARFTAFLTDQPDTTWPCSTPAIGRGPVWRTASAARRTPARGTCRATPSPASSRPADGSSCASNTTGRGPNRC